MTTPSKEAVEAASSLWLAGGPTAFEKNCLIIQAAITRACEEYFDANSALHFKFITKIANQRLDELQQLRQENAANQHLRADKERLDWLETATYIMLKGGIIIGSDRQAIDDARKEKK